MKLLLISILGIWLLVSSFRGTTSPTARAFMAFFSLWLIYSIGF